MSMHDFYDVDVIDMIGGKRPGGRLCSLVDNVAALYRQAGVVVAGRWLAQKSIEQMLVHGV